MLKTICSRQSHRVCRTHPAITVFDLARDVELDVGGLNERDEHIAGLQREVAHRVDDGESASLLDLDTRHGRSVTLSDSQGSRTLE